MPVEGTRGSDPLRPLLRKGGEYARDAGEHSVAAGVRKITKQFRGEIARQRRKLGPAFGGKLRRDASEKVDQPKHRDGREIRDEAIKFDLAVGLGVPPPHPFDRIEYLFGVPDPISHAGERVRGIAVAVQYKGIDSK